MAVKLPGALSDSLLMTAIHLSTSSLDDPANCHTDQHTLTSGDKEASDQHKIVTAIRHWASKRYP